MKSLNIFYYVLVFILLGGISSCEKEPDEEPEPEESKKENSVVTPDFLDIADAKSLVVINEGSQRKSTNEDPHSNGNLYKIKENGEIVQVMFRDQNGQPFDRIVYYNDNGDSIVNYPQLIVNEINELSDDYLLVEGSFSYLDISDLENPHDVFYENLLLRISDGALFDFNDKINWYRSCRYKNRYLYSDYDGNIYYTSKSSDYNIQKLSTLEDGGLTRENILPFNQKFKSYCVDGEGNLFYRPGELGSTVEGFNVKVANGGIIQMDNDLYHLETDTIITFIYTDFDWIWIDDDKMANAIIGKDSMVYNEALGEWDDYAAGLLSIMNLRVNNSTIQFESRIERINELFENFQWFVNFYVYRTRYQNEMIFIYGRSGPELKTELWALDIENSTYRKGIIPVNEGEYIEAIIHDGDEFIYLGINSKLLKISKKDFTYTNFLPDNQYDIFALSVSEDDVVTFNALRYSDAEIILGEIDQSGTVTIIKEDMEVPVTSLVRIN
jgi:hypothetical protein